MIKSIGTVHGVNVTIKGGNDLLLVELAALIRTIRKSLESEGSSEEAFLKIRECGELAFLDDDEFTEQITDRLQDASEQEGEK